MSITMGHFMMVMLIVIPLNKLYALAFHTDIVTVNYISTGILIHTAIVVNVDAVQTVHNRPAWYMHVQIPMSGEYIYYHHCKNKYGCYYCFFKSHHGSP